MVDVCAWLATRSTENRCFIFHIFIDIQFVSSSMEHWIYSSPRTLLRHSPPQYTAERLLLLMTGRCRCEMSCHVLTAAILRIQYSSKKYIFHINFPNSIHRQFQFLWQFCIIVLLQNARVTDLVLIFLLQFIHRILLMIRATTSCSTTIAIAAATNTMTIFAVFFFFPTLRLYWKATIIYYFYFFFIHLPNEKWI